MSTASKEFWASRPRWVISVSHIEGGFDNLLYFSYRDCAEALGILRASPSIECIETHHFENREAQLRWMS